MKIAEQHQQGRAGDVIIKLKKSFTIVIILLLDKWIPDGRLLFKNLFP